MQSWESEVRPQPMGKRCSYHLSQSKHSYPSCLCVSVCSFFLVHPPKQEQSFALLRHCNWSDGLCLWNLKLISNSRISKVISEFLLSWFWIQSSSLAFPHWLTWRVCFPVFHSSVCMTSIFFTFWNYTLIDHDSTTFLNRLPLAKFFPP